MIQLAVPSAKPCQDVGCGSTLMTAGVAFQYQLVLTKMIGKDVDVEGHGAHWHTVARSRYTHPRNNSYSISARQLLYGHTRVSDQWLDTTPFVLALLIE
jgi:hypothetical protein